MMKRSSERGSAMLVTLIIVTAILAGAAVLVSLQLGANKNTEITRTGISALYCAEAGISATRQTIADNQANWNTYLGTGTEPAWLSALSHDVDGDSSNDFIVTLEDDKDESPDVPTNDANNRVYIVSRCVNTKFYPDTVREVRELISKKALANCYNGQRGGCGGNGNMN
jgi:type II secretory pathway pseudopilin PulG